MSSQSMRKAMGLVATCIILFALSQPVTAASLPTIPTINLGVDSAGNPVEVAQSLQILLLLTVLSLAPSILVLTTSFTRLVIVLSFTRSALGTQQMPPNQVMIGLALLLTMFIMAPVFGAIYQDAWM
ncbi:MAG: flagellar biosynthetic protein FliP, partial [Bacillota bacterium]